MTAKGNEPRKASSSIAYVLLAGLSVAVGVGAFYALEAQATPLIRMLALAAGVVLGIALVFISDHGKRLLAYASNARTEVQKMVWPSRQETTQMTITVLIAVTLVALFLWAIDSFFLWGVRLITGA